MPPSGILPPFDPKSHKHIDLADPKVAEFLLQYTAALDRLRIVQAAAQRLPQGSNLATSLNTVEANAQALQPQLDIARQFPLRLGSILCSSGLGTVSSNRNLLDWAMVWVDAARVTEQPRNVSPP